MVFRARSNREAMNPTLSVIIPTLNEENYLPRLLTALAQQTRVPDEIIVADAGSTDRTVSMAQEHGANVVAGGRPARGRNAGARIASGDLLLFLDADVIPPPIFVESSIRELERRALDVATGLMLPLSDRISDKMLHSAANSYLRAVRHVSPHAVGCCILVRRATYLAIGGFNESVLLAEDHDFVKRGARFGKFGVLTSMRIPVSVRRLDEERLTKLFLQYLWAEANTLAGRPVYSIPFGYRFGGHDGLGSSQPKSPHRNLTRWVRLQPKHLREKLSVNWPSGAFIRKMNTRWGSVRHRIRDLW